MYQNLIKKIKVHIQYLKEEVSEDADMHPGVKELLNHIYSIGYNDGLQGYVPKDEQVLDDDIIYEEEDEEQ